VTPRYHTNSLALLKGSIKKKKKEKKTKKQKTNTTPKKPTQQLAPSHVLTCQGHSNYINGVETFIIKQRLCFRPLYERLFPRLKVTCLTRHAVCWSISSIIKVNAFLSLQCFLTPNEAAQSSSPAAAPLTLHPGLHPQSDSEPDGHPPTHPSIHLSAPGQQRKEEKTLKHP